VARARNLNLNTVSPEFRDDVTIITGQKPKAIPQDPNSINNVLHSTS